MSEQFVLRWHYQEITLLGNLSTFLDTDVLTDVTISVDSHNIKAHRLVLAMCSVYFFQLFQEMGNTQHPVIVLHNVALSDLKAVLSFIYRGQCIVSKDQLPGMLSLARLLKIQGLCDMKVPENPVQSEISTLNIKRQIVPGNNEHFINEIFDYDFIKPLSSAAKTDPLWDKTSDGLVEAQLKPNDTDDFMNIQIEKKISKEPSETCKCFLCGKYLSNQYNLRVHMETHEEAYHACQCCPHVSRSRDALRKHVSYRHPEEYNTRKRKK